jgi:hypothetical protein
MLDNRAVVASVVATSVRRRTNTARYLDQLHREPSAANQAKAVTSWLDRWVSGSDASDIPCQFLSRLKNHEIQKSNPATYYYKIVTKK